MMLLINMNLHPRLFCCKRQGWCSHQEPRLRGLCLLPGITFRTFT